MTKFKNAFLLLNSLFIFSSYVVCQNDTTAIQSIQPSYINGYAAPFEFVNVNDDTSIFWVQYMGVNEIHDKVHNYRIYRPDSTIEDHHFITFDSHELDLSNKEYVFKHILSTLPEITIMGVTTEVIGAYPVSYPKCYINDTTSHQILCVATDYGVDYPCLMSYGKENDKISMLLRGEKGIIQVTCNVSSGVGLKSTDIIVVDFKNKKILFENYDEWIDINVK